VQLLTSDVSESGLFIPTTEDAAPGEAVEVELHLPDGNTFMVTGTVANVIDEATAAQHGGSRGLGVRLDPLEGERKQRFEQIVEAARRQQPRPETPRPQARAETQTDRGRPRADTDLAVPEEVPVSATGSVSVLAVQSAAQQAGAGAVARRVASIKSADKGPIVGIDLGTTYTSVAAVVDHRVRILSGPNGERSLPSVIAFPRRGQVIVGAEARARVATDPAHTVVSPKRLLGRHYDDREVQTMVGRVPYRTFAGPDDTTVIEIWGDQFAVPQLFGHLFSEVRRWAEAQLGTTVRRVVCTVPISFEDARVDALRRAAKFAQLDVVSVIDEPSAAALANRFDKHFGGKVGVYDFGGGTFDFSVVDVGGGDFHVLATAGDTWLGGDDFDQVLAEAAANQFWRQHKVDLRSQAIEWQRLLFACEQAKRELSASNTATIVVPEVLRTAHGMVDLKLAIDRDILSRASSAIIERSLDTCRQALEMASLDPADLSCVYLSGGTTNVLAVREALDRYFKVPVRTGVPAEHAVCLGAAIHGAQLQMRGAVTLPDR
jgi:molecular chaperone DnaK (HSP70)